MWVKLFWKLPIGAVCGLFVYLHTPEHPTKPKKKKSRSAVAPLRAAQMAPFSESWILDNLKAKGTCKTLLAGALDSRRCSGCNNLHLDVLVDGFESHTPVL
jgi:hypothetical protein